MINLKSFFLVIILLTTGFSFSQTGSVNEIGTLTIIISDFSNDEGDCWFAINNTEEIYEREDTVWIGKILSIKNKEVIVTIDSIVYGEYAVKVFHDENRNGELDTDILGIPSEDYGYSNDASGWFGPPSWEKAKFIFNEPEMTIRISVD